jgi:hypothetical protein
MAPKIKEFFKKIKTDYPEELQDLKFYAKSSKKLAKAVARKEFLIKCRKNGIFPTHITQNIKGLIGLIGKETPYIKNIQNAQFGIKRKILNLEIKNTFYSVQKMFRLRDAAMERVVKKIPRHICEKFFAIQASSMENLTNVSRHKCDANFDKLYVTQLFLSKKITNRF